MAIHRLKTWPVYFSKLLTGNKTFELRKNDRDFKVGDILVLEEFASETKEFSGRSLEFQITYILELDAYLGLDSNFVILGIRETKIKIAKPNPGELPRCRVVK